MIQVHVLVFITLLELIVVFAALWLVWFFKVRTLNRRQEALRAVSSSEPAAHGDGAYFAKELVATRAQIDIFAKDGPDVPLTALKLRAAYLDIEREFAQGQQRDATFWDQVRLQLSALLEMYAPATPQIAIADDIAENLDELPAADDVVAGNQDEQPAADDEHEGAPDDNPQPASQASVLAEFRNALGALLADQHQNPDMRVHADRLMRCSRELAMCLSVLEDDNGYLREKLKAAGIMHD